MLVDITTAIIGPFGFRTGKPMQVEQMSNDSHYWPNQVFPMAGQVRFNHCWPSRVLQLCSEVGVITCTVIIIEEEPTHEGS